MEGQKRRKKSRRLWRVVSLTASVFSYVFPMTTTAVMPIRPENRARYPADWPEISRAVREDAGWRCEGSPAFPDCRAENGKPHPVTGSKVVLTVAHLNHDPADCRRANLRAWCQRCHNVYDAPMRRHGIRRRRDDERGQEDLFDREPGSSSSKT
ncbi:MAG: hypothetical protein AAF676_08375 [Pseudomonadota bacterium]